MKFIFLDVDGVLNSTRWSHIKGWDKPTPRKKYYKSGKRFAKDAKLDPSTVFLLNELCKVTKAKVIISSFWR